ncbi:protocatechuate 4,5-dioxygenase subunit alpha [Novosphingobium sp. SL115]|uniref:protocatechuate 4,5-dioxygenase subunit alpha n=1 Tax=Novosphingobium sp. SL115 TaxID=2995150 RepID=UPI00227334FE|nr:protocatechuate 4,5-dioxygenase subunit alpha [Novosphingobium sp. SL115]MCY1672517.1 protocatechuate 4,5-dioxygenase subunit alpha [Novosphingobium sp. SL115]
MNPHPVPDAAVQTAQALRRSIPLFDGGLATRGFELNAMCFSFNDKVNRDAFVADEDAYCARFNLTADQRKAVADRDVLAMLDAGGNVYYLAKLAGIFGLGVQDLGALQTGLSVNEFKAMLVKWADKIPHKENA